LKELTRVTCGAHGVVQVSVRWTKGGLRFTALFESLVIDWLREASFAAVARHLHEAVNTVRRQEHRSLREEGDRTLTGTKYLWLESPRTMGRDRRTLLSRMRAGVRGGRGR
jgi:hypothetical protein